MILREKNPEINQSNKSFLMHSVNKKDKFYYGVNKEFLH